MKLNSFLSCLIIVSIFYSCSEENIPMEKELINYPWIESFTPGRKNFQGIEHNLELGIYKFSFETIYSLEEFYKIVDRNAASNNWLLIKSSANKKIYKKESEIYSAAKVFDFVTLMNEPVNERILFTYEANKPH